MKRAMSTVKNIAAAAMTLAVVFGFAGFKPVIANAAQATVPISSKISTNPSMRASPVSVLQRIIYQGWRARKHPGDEKIKEIRGLCRMVIIWAVKLKRRNHVFSLLLGRTIVAALTS